MEVIKLSQYQGDKVAIIDANGNTLILSKEELCHNRMLYEDADIRGVRETTLEKAISDLATGFVEKIQKMFGVSVSDVSEFWAFMKIWSSKFLKDSNNNTLVMLVSDEKSIVFD